MTELMPKFKIGQLIFCASVSWSEIKIKCPDCLGTLEWEVHTPAGEVFKHPCNTCKYGWQNSGYVSEWKDAAQIVLRTVGSIQTDTASNTPIRYMCEETGIGSGSIYNEANLFATKEAAEEWCAEELKRVSGLRQAKELDDRKIKKADHLLHGKRKK